MGYYIQTDEKFGKALWLINAEGAELLPHVPQSFSEIPEDKALIVVVQNELFEAAGYAYDEHEFERFTNPLDDRPKWYVLMDKARAEELSGYNQRRISR